MSRGSVCQRGFFFAPLIKSFKKYLNFVAESLFVFLNAGRWIMKNILSNELDRIRYPDGNCPGQSDYGCQDGLQEMSFIEVQTKSGKGYG